jgi:hypothetical protein
MDARGYRGKPKSILFLAFVAIVFAGFALRRRVVLGPVQRAICSSGACE